MKAVVQAVSNGLSDLSISRPVGRLTWGIPVPDDETQTIYVWLDALINYLTTSNYPFQIPGEEDSAGWPADVHVVGKDIVRYFKACGRSQFTLLTNAKVSLHILACFSPRLRHTSTASSPNSCPLDPGPAEDG